MELGGVFKALRQKAGLSQEELAEKLHVNQSDISKYENDNKLPDLHTFFRYMQVTNAPEVAVAFMYGTEAINLIPTVMQMLGM